MAMRISFLLCIMGIFFNSISAEEIERKVKFSVSLQDDTVMIGEPMIFRWQFTNMSDAPQKIILPKVYLFLEAGCLKILLYTPDAESFWYKVGTDIYVLEWDKAKIFKSLSPGDSIYSLTLLWWGNFRREYQSILQKNMPAGLYKVNAQLKIPGMPLLKSEEFNFYAYPPQGNDSVALKELSRASRLFWWPGAQTPDERKYFSSIFKKASKIDSKLAEFAYYLYATNLQGREGFTELQKFLKKYPNSPLVEMARVRLAKGYYDLLGDKEKARKELLKLKSEYPGFYSYTAEEILKTLNEGEK